MSTRNMLFYGKIRKKKTDPLDSNTTSQEKMLCVPFLDNS